MITENHTIFNNNGTLVQISLPNQDIKSLFRESKESTLRLRSRARTAIPKSRFSKEGMSCSWSWMHFWEKALSVLRDNIVRGNFNGLARANCFSSFSTFQDKILLFTAEIDHTFI